jgi:hypothetical protein
MRLPSAMRILIGEGRMDGKGWRPEYGISAEGIEVLGYLEALPKEVRRELTDAVAALCRREGYLSLHDDVRKRLVPNEPDQGGDLAKVIPLFRRSQPG